MVKLDIAYLKQQIEDTESRIQRRDTLIVSAKEWSLEGKGEEWKAARRKWLESLISGQDSSRAELRLYEKWLQAEDEKSKLMQGRLPK